MTRDPSKRRLSSHAVVRELRSCVIRRTMLSPRRSAFLASEPQKSSRVDWSDGGKVPPAKSEIRQLRCNDPRAHRLVQSRLEPARDGRTADVHPDVPAGLFVRSRRPGLYSPDASESTRAPGVHGPPESKPLSRWYPEHENNLPDIAPWYPPEVGAHANRGSRHPARGDDRISEPAVEDATLSSR